MNLISESERKKTLIDAGFPEKFITALDSLEDISPELESCISYPKGAYFYLPIIKDFEIFRGYNALPICDNYTGESFFTYIFNEVEGKIIYSYPDEDKIYDDYGMNIDFFLADILVSYYEWLTGENFEGNETTFDKIADVGFKIGLNKDSSYKLVKMVYESDINNVDRYGSNSKSWREKMYKKIFSN